jgi:hypothetical protein
MIPMGYEVSWQLAKRRNEETKKRKRRMVPMGNTLEKRGTMVDRV